LESAALRASVRNANAADDAYAAEIHADLAAAIERAQRQPEGEAAIATAGDAELDRRRAAKLEEARSAVAAAEARFARHQEAEAETERRRQALARLTEIEQKAAVDLAEADAAWASASQLEHDAAHRLIAIEADLAAATAAERAAAAALESSADEQSQARAIVDVDEMTRAMAAAAEKAAVAAADVESLEAELASIETRLHDIEDAAPVASTAPTEGELEWYLLARLAAQRSVSYAGSVPLVLDEALREVTGPALVRVLERLERMSGAVQLVVLSDDPAASEWAEHAGPERALLLTG
jgi:colicin import membrane protein